MDLWTSLESSLLAWPQAWLSLSTSLTDIWSERVKKNTGSSKLMFPCESEDPIHMYTIESTKLQNFPVIIFNEMGLYFIVSTLIAAYWLVNSVIIRCFLQLNWLLDVFEWGCGKPVGLVCSDQNVNLKKKRDHFVIFTQTGALKCKAAELQNEEEEIIEQSLNNNGSFEQER